VTLKKIMKKANRCRNKQSRNDPKIYRQRNL
jgi:hypothetical protein